jgi:hypothetical protein
MPEKRDVPYSIQAEEICLTIIGRQVKLGRKGNIGHISLIRIC